ncbi:hypothetical protein ACHHYP_11367 [Achlya hypogyna]|uniref:Glutamine cyclotransferase n=1 Tax=Achlya hypogyna TaxID=1202772 RepID=A0A1V9YJA5_ACHHY|nr:hypothetical protein ACHHYP_11367 [Achlya hypogyna]
MAILLCWLGLACMQVLAQETFKGFGAVQTHLSSRPVHIVAIHPHNVSSFTEGLLFDGGHLLESTGLNGQSFIREIDPVTSLYTGKEFQFPDSVFGEGIAVVDDTIYALTYVSQRGFAIDRKTFALVREFAFATTTGEGWGMTTDGTLLIVSDGSAVLLFFDPATMREVRRVTVALHGEPVANINELEYVHGEVFANVWFTTQILRIDAATGRVKEVLELAQLPFLEGHKDAIADPARKADAVMNGIAHNPSNNHLYITGKMWDAVFELDVVLAPAAAKTHLRRIHGQVIR